MFMLSRWATLSLIVIASLPLVSCGGAEERKAKYLERGKAYLAEKNYEKAMVELKNVLQIDPKSAEGYFLLGKVEEERKDYGKAYGDYTMALELNPDHQEAREKLARIYIMTDQQDKAEELIAYTLKKKPNDPVARILHSVLLANKGKHDEAQKIALEVLKEHPERTEAAVLVSAIYVRNGDNVAAEKTLKDSIEKNPKNIALHTTLAQFYFNNKETDKAASVLHKIVEIEPDVIMHRATLATFYVQAKNIGKAEQVLRDAIKANPKDSKRHNMLASFLVSQNRGAEAESGILSAIEMFPEDFSLRFSLAGYYLSVGKPEQAKEIYRKVIELDRVGPEGMNGRKYLADLLRSEGKNDEALALLADVLKENSRDAEALLIRGKIAMGKDKPDFQSAITDFRSILKDQPDSVEVLMLLAYAHQQNHEPVLVRESLQKAVKAAPKNVNATISFAEFLATNDKDVDAALKVLNDFLSATPDDLTVIQAKLNLLGKKGDHNGMLEILANLKKEYPEKPVGFYRSGEYYLSQGKFKEALSEFEQARDRSKGQFQAIGAISMVYMRMNQQETALKILDEYLSDHPKSLEALQMKGGILAGSKDAAGFVKVTDLIKKYYPDQANGYFIAGEFYLEQKSYGDAIREFMIAAEKAPENPRISSSIVKTYLADDKPDDAINWLNKQVAARPDDGYFHYLIAEVLLSQKKYVEAEKELQTALQLMPASDEDNKPKRSEVYFRMADVDVMQNQLESAVKILKQGLTVVPEDINLSIRLASVYELSGQFDNAIATYNEILRHNSDNILAANNLAALLVNHKSDKASLDRAKQLTARFESTDQPALLDTLGWVYYKLNDIDSAIPVLKKAVDKAPESGELRYHLGMAYYKKGDMAAAKAELTRAFAGNEKFTGEDEGRATLKALQ